MTDTARELALIFHPDPPESTEENDNFYQEQLKAIKAARKAAEAYFTSIEPSDPVLDQLNQLSIAKQHLEELIRLLLAYARDFTRPEPYRLHALATATGMSISGVRTAYGQNEKDIVAERIQRGDRHHSPPESSCPQDDYVPIGYIQPGYRVANWLIPPLSRPVNWEEPT
ncbi:hypothetical protein [Streptosporangium sp. KLBMP 9127]|nr:hypothetical protein [Streptosporangium sp. KLBMP 9127]